MLNVKCLEEELMQSLKIEDIITATGGDVIARAKDSFAGISIDSRTVREGELFIALKGSRFDGHAFLYEALKRGSGAIVDTGKAKYVTDKTIIAVQDTLKALQDIGRHMRISIDIPVVGITGSNGKTTTKELISSILETQHKILKNTGNLNNHIGLPLSLTRISHDDEIIVLEMGASGPGEIRVLCNIAGPDYGVITNIGYAHLEGFKDIETVRKTKLELLDSVKAAVVNADDLFLMEGVNDSGFRGRIVRYGIKNPAEVFADTIQLHEKGSKFTLHLPEGKSIEVNPKISGMFNIYNILAAASVGHLFNIEPERIQNAIDSFAGVPMRLEIKEYDGIKVISDVYNANPISMEEAVKELKRLKKGRGIAVLGDMLELGPYAEEAHKALGTLLSQSAIEVLIAVGPLMTYAASGFTGTVYTLETAQEAGRILKEIWVKGDTVLIKGSRGMKLEKVLEG
jgi:UDP-N-acetylmuramoyl-tripeptide--D-alanyl-D-alanine ligase